MNRVAKWAMVGVGVIVAVAVVRGAIVDHGKHRTALPAHPIPIGQAADLGRGWSLKVLRVSTGAARAAQAAEQAHPPPTGSRYYLVKLAVTYTGGGQGDPGALLGYGTEVVDVDGATFDGTNATCGNYVPRPALGRAGELVAGHTARGYDCYQVPASAVKTLLLHTGDFSSPLRIGLKGLRDRWFDLP